MSTLTATQVSTPWQTMQALAAQGKAAHPHLASRLDKALALIASGGVEYDEHIEGWWVRGTSHEAYLVTIRGGHYACTCPDHAHRERWCKHALAVALVRRAADEAAAPTLRCRRCGQPARKLDPTGLCGDCVKVELFGLAEVA